MQSLNPLRQLVNAASSMKDIAQNTKTYVFMVPDPVTFYLQTEHTEVEIHYWERALIEMTVQLQVPLGWRIAAEQDEAGVYIAAVRRNVIGGLSSACFTIRLPYETHIMLNLHDGALLLNNINGKLELPPQRASDAYMLIDGNSSGDEV